MQPDPAKTQKAIDDLAAQCEALSNENAWQKQQITNLDRRVDELESDIAAINRKLNDRL